MNDEKIYFTVDTKDGQIKVTNSRVIFPEHTFILRNIAAINTTTRSEYGCLSGCLSCLSIILFICGLGALDYESMAASLFLIGLGVFVFFSARMLRKRREWIVKIDSGGTSIDSFIDTANSFITRDQAIAESVVEAVNQALLDLDKNSTSENASNSKDKTSFADELKELKNLLDEEIITQAEFDAKKKEILGL